MENDITNIPTAKEFFKNFVGEYPDNFNINIEDVMIEFAKLHIEETKKKVMANIKLMGNCYWSGTICGEEKFDSSYDVYIDKSSIVNCYFLK